LQFLPSGDPVSASAKRSGRSAAKTKTGKFRIGTSCSHKLNAGASKPANPNEVVILYGTGFGPVSPPLLTGVPATLNQTATPTVTIDGLSAQVQFSAIAPGFVGLN
jgi:uncharacterized protein (TIGR03437 family)